MRKWIAAFMILLLLLFGIYWLIPGKIKIHQTVTIPVNTKAFARKIIDEQSWHQWWPGVKSNTKQPGSKFEFNGNTYSITEKKLTSLLIEVSSGKDSILTELIFIPIGIDTIQLNWVGAQRTGSNPLRRFQTSNWIKNVDEDLHSVLEKMNSFYAHEENIYGFQIEKALVADSNYMFTSLQTKEYPSTSIIYGLTDRLRFYIQNNNAQPTGYPMVNIYRDGDSSYLTKVALPVNMQLKNSGDIQYRWMLKGGNILVAEIKGGQNQIEKAFSEMANYVDDHQRIAPAIPFQSLVTDRRQEPDTNKWVTKIYWPVM